MREFAVINPASRNSSTTGYCGLLTSGNEDPKEICKIDVLSQVMREEALQERLSLTIDAKNIEGYPEALECLDQLLITSESLHRYPEACDGRRVAFWEAVAI